MPSVLLIDERPDFVERLRRELPERRADIEQHSVTRGQRAVEALSTSRFDAIVIGAELPGPVDCAQVLTAAASRQPNCRALVVTAFGAPEISVSASGAWVRASLLTPTEDLIAALGSMVDSKPGFDGTLRQLDSGDLIILCAFGIADRRLHVRRHRKHGWVDFARGEIVAASFDGALGEEALVSIAATPDMTVVCEAAPKGAPRDLGISSETFLADLLPRALELRATAATTTAAIAGVDVPDLSASAPTRSGPELFSAQEIAELSSEHEPLSDGEPTAPSRRPDRIITGETPHVDAAMLPSEMLEPEEATRTPADPREAIGGILGELVASGVGVAAAGLVGILDGELHLVAPESPPLDVGLLGRGYSHAARAVASGWPRGTPPSEALGEIVSRSAATQTLFVSVPDTALALVAIQPATAEVAVARTAVRASARAIAQVLRGTT